MEVCSSRLTYNLRQLKKQVDWALEKGAETVEYDMDRDNPNLRFHRERSKEQETREYINKLGSGMHIYPNINTVEDEESSLDILVKLEKEGVVKKQKRQAP